MRVDENSKEGKKRKREERNKLTCGVDNIGHLERKRVEWN